MKKFANIFLLLGLFFFFTVNINAADDDLSPTSQAQLNTQKEAIDKYCSENETVKGCLYDKNNTLYTQSVKANYGVGITEAGMSLTESYLMPAGVELTRGYQTFDGNGNAVFSGCYRYQKTNYKGENETYFIFQIVYGDSSGKNCKVRHSFAIPASGVSQYMRGTQWNGKDFLWNQFEWGGLFSYPALMNNWVAKSNGDCPKVFGYTANVSWYTANNNKYIFSENADDFKITTISFFSGEAYKTRPGCTVEDVDGKEKAQELLDKVLKEIKNKTCPAKIEDMNSYQDNLEKWYENLRKNNEYRVLWSAGLIDEVTKKSAQEQISAAIHEKISDCQYTICKIDSSKRQTIESNLGVTCKNGCTLSNVKTPSDSDKAKCYCCGNSQGCVYQWIEEGGSNCGLQSNISKDQCIGTSKDLECRRCLVNAYDKAGLTDEQKSCMAGSEIAKLLTESNIEKANEETADQDKEKEIEENKELREKIYEKLNQPEIKFDFEIPSGNISSCVDLLGPNLTAVVKASFLILQIVAAIIAVVKGMMTLIPPILAKDADALKKAGNVLTKMAIVLVIIFLLKPLLHFLGSILDFDISCLV